MAYPMLLPTVFCWNCMCALLLEKLVSIGGVITYITVVQVGRYHKLVQVEPDLGRPVKHTRPCQARFVVGGVIDHAVMDTVP